MLKRKPFYFIMILISVLTLGISTATFFLNNPSGKQQVMNGSFPKNFDGKMPENMQAPPDGEKPSKGEMPKDGENSNMFPDTSGVDQEQMQSIMQEAQENGWSSELEQKAKDIGMSDEMITMFKDGGMPDKNFQDGGMPGKNINDGSSFFTILRVVLIVVSLITIIFCVFRIYRITKSQKICYD